jgi:hypothetical protein
VWIGACVLVAAAVFVARPAWASTLGLDVWNVPALKAELRDMTEESGRLDSESEDVRRRVAVKEQIIAELIARRMTLAEATDRFVQLNSYRPEILEVIRAKYPSGSDFEKTARNVIDYVLVRVAVPERPAVARRLESELRQMLTAGAGH